MNNSKTIGILTFHDGINYGAFFQCYALQRFLTSIGYKSRIISYKSLGFTLREYKVLLGLHRLHSFSILRFVETVKKIYLFRNFQRELSRTKRLFSTRQLQHLMFDRIILGSDEIWNFENKIVGYDLTYFSKGLLGNKLIAYAPSFGNISTDSLLPAPILAELQNLHNFSSRDLNTQNLLRKVSNLPVPLVVDPTMLIELPAESFSFSRSKYILIYGQFTQQQIEAIESLARDYKMPLISVGYYHPWCDKNYVALSPFEWHGAIKSATVVVTSMYHGVIFSIINRKQFVLFSSPYRENKFSGLFEKLGLETANLAIDPTSTAAVPYLDYSIIDQNIEDWISQSKQYLHQSLKHS